MKKIIVFLASAAAIISASSCAKQLEVTPPNAIYDEQIIDIMENGTDAQRQLVLNAIASPFAKYFNMWGSPMPGGVLAPMSYCYQGIEQARSLQGNDMVFGLNKNNVNDLAGTSYYEGTAQYTSEDSEANKAHWFGYAYCINQANLLLGYMTKEAAAASAAAADGRVRGLLVRAYSYMCLAEEYCQPYADAGATGVGLSLYSKYAPAQAAVAPSTLKETWDFILTDLKEAVALTGSNFTNAYDQLEDFDAGLANFLFARASLLVGNYADVITACDKIINSGKYSFILAENYGCNPTGAAIGQETRFEPQNNAFTALKKNPETIFGYKKTSSYNPHDGSNRAGVQTMLQNPFGSYSSGGSTVRMDNRLYEKIAANDVRKNAFYPSDIAYHFEGSAAGTITTIPSYSAMKYGSSYALNDTGDGPGMSGTEKDYSQVELVEFCKFRLSEVYLMKAEAQAKGTGDAVGTLDALLKARTMPGQTALTCATYPSMSGLDAFEMVKLQWRIEMWGENGREYFNNKRWHINIDRQSSAIHWAKNLATSWKDMTLDIPKEEKQNNSYYSK